MTGQLNIVEGGLLTTIQDQGRFGFRKYGVPISGTMDNHSAELANWLVSNHKNNPVIECTLQGPTIEFKTEATVGMSGGKGSIKLNKEDLQINKTFKVEAGDVLKIGSIKKGCRLYIAVSGEWNLEQIMKSYSTCLQAKFGGYKGRKLKSGDVLSWEGAEVEIEQKEIPKKIIPHFSTRQKIRIMPGPEWKWLSEHQRANFLNILFPVLGSSNRMGILLKSSADLKILNDDMKSAPVVPGMIQLPPDGNPIILMKDAQSVGGYPRIAKVAEADMWRIGQLWQGNKINFSLIGRDESIQLLNYLKGLKEKHL